jgi:hypothetical protein
MKINSKKIFFGLLLFITATLFACKKPKVKIPADVISEDSIVKILADVQLAEAAAINNQTGEFVSDTLMAGYYKFVFEKYKITPQHYSRSIAWYSAHPTVYEKITENVITELSSMQAKSLQQK